MQETVYEIVCPHCGKKNKVIAKFPPRKRPALNATKATPSAAFFLKLRCCKSQNSSSKFLTKIRQCFIIKHIFVKEIRHELERSRRANFVQRKSRRL